MKGQVIHTQVVAQGLVAHMQKVVAEGQGVHTQVVAQGLVAHMQEVVAEQPGIRKQVRVLVVRKQV